MGEDATQSVDRLLDNIEYDDIRGIVFLPATDDSVRHGDMEFSSLDDVRSYLEEAYNSSWYANVPFDSGEAVFEGDADGYVGDLLADRGVEDFFEVIRAPDDGDPILQSKELITDHSKSTLLQVDLTEINEELIKYFAQHPEQMRTMHPRKFEQLIAELLKRKGFHVELTPASKDGGYDIIAIQRDDLGSAMTLVECKRYNANNKVGVEIVRGLYGVVEQEKATRGLIMTTSYFTKGAQTFRDQIKNRMTLSDYDALTDFIRGWKQTPGNKSPT